MKIDRKVLGKLDGMKLSKPELRFIVGGCEIDGGVLPDVTITCGQYEGRCWDCLFIMKGEFSGYCRYNTGDRSHYCSAPVKCHELL